MRAAKAPSYRIGLYSVAGALLPGDSTGGLSSSQIPRLLRLSTAFFALAFLFVASASTAAAAQTRAYTGLAFGPDGSGGTETFLNAQSVTVDQASGDVFVYDAGGLGRVYKFDAAGNPVPFKPSGPNYIDDVGGAGAGENEIAVAPPNSSGGTAGDIYVAHSLGPLEIFSPEGEEIETIGEGEICGVAVDTSGHIFVGVYPETILEYVPSTNPPTNADLSPVAAHNFFELCNVAADGIGNVYASKYSLVSLTKKFSGLADPSPTSTEPGGPTLTVDPATNDIYLDEGDHVSAYDSTSEHLYDFGSEQLTSSYGVGIGRAADRVYVGDGGSGRIKVFGSIVPVPTTTIAPASNLTGTKATLNGAVSPEGLAVEECFFEWGETTAYGNIAPCEGETPPDHTTHSVHADIAGLVPDGAEYHFRLVAKNENGTEHSADETLITAPTVITDPATGLRLEAATLQGTLRPEGRHYTNCRFEYGPDAAFGFELEAPCEPDATQFPEDFSPHPVALSLIGLQPNTDYKFRLTATTASGGTVHGETLSFSTVGAPRITEILSRADRNSAVLEATVDPRADDTSYRIEWGPTDAYGHIAVTGSVPGAQGPTRVTAQLLNLAAASRYHFRIVVANSEGGEALTPDQLVETLNSCGFTDARCLELVSPADKGPFSRPGKKLVFAGSTVFQAAAGGSALAYDVISGYPETSAGNGAALYLARRSSQGWSSEQLDPPTVVPPIGRGDVGYNSAIKPLSPDLGCGAIASLAPLTPDAPAASGNGPGLFNLYLSDYSSRSYQLITRVAPVNQTAESIYGVVGMSPDCQRVIFRTPNRYPGIGAANVGFQLYEWEHGTIRNLGLIPGPGGGGEPVVAGSVPGALGELTDEPGDGEPTDYWRAISADGSRAIFTALSQFGADSGRRAIFSRDANDPDVAAGTAAATDISQSETATPNDGNSRYWIASADGRRIFFTARYGLAANGSSSGATSCSNAPNGGPSEGSGEGCDLYEYDAAAADGARLTDLSTDPDDAKGAGVIGVLDASEDGSYVYFAARGRLGDAGRTEVQNLKARTYNIYLAHAGTVRYVHGLGETEALGQAINGSNALVRTETNNRWTSRSIPDGTSLAFESSLGTPGGVPMVYLFSAADGTTVCVSCRRDGLAPFAVGRLTPLIDALETNYNERTIEPTILTDNGRLYFYSFDPLAPGAIEGQRNLFQWEHGQISLIASEPPNVPRHFGNPEESFFGGASADGGDIYFVTPQDLIGSDHDGRWDIYDARVGGGFPESAPPTEPCDSAAEGACNPGGANPPAAAPATSNFGGPGNPATKKRRKHHRKKHHRARHHKKHGRPRHGKAVRHGPADGGRRAGR